MDTQTLASKISAKSQALKDLKMLLDIMNEEKTDASVTVVCNSLAKGKGISYTIKVCKEDTPALHKTLCEAISQDMEQNTEAINMYAKQLYTGN